MPADDVRPLYRVLLWLGAAGAVILAAGLLEFFHFEPLGEHTGTRAEIQGVYSFDPASGETSGPASERFRRDDSFAARVDWSTLPPDLPVGARWYNSFGEAVGRAGPAPAAQLVSHPVVPAELPEGQRRNLPGHYLFVVERFEGKLPVEVLARRIVIVERDA